jgi:seryl-tRNA synthetase
MLDIKLLRERPDIVVNDLKRRGDKEKEKWVAEFRKLDEERRKLLYKAEQDRKERNAISKEIARMVKEKKDISFNRKQMAAVNDRIKKAEERLAKLDEKSSFYLLRFPNILHESVPEGRDDSQNKEIRKWGHQPTFAFRPKNHIELMESLGLLDLERAGKVAGSRFFYMKGAMVLLNMALMRFGMEQLVKAGFTPVQPPFMMNREAYTGVTDLDDFENVMYKVEKEDLYMIATSEHPMVAMHMKETVPEASLPVRYAGISTNFRKEAGTHGMEDKGIFRVHQFDKVEQLVLARPEDSWEEHERLIKTAEETVRQLELPYRLVSVCTGDIGTVAAKKYDIEAWVPSQKRYREIISCSNCTDYQARRLNIRYGTEGEKPKGFVHTLNSTAVVSRMLVPMLENYQRKDGTIAIPKALQNHMAGMKKIG